MPGQDAVEDFLQLVGFQEVFELEEGDANLLTIMGYLFIVTQQGCTVLLQKRAVQYCYKNRTVSFSPGKKTPRNVYFKHTVLYRV